MSAPGLRSIERRVVGSSVWLSRTGEDAQDALARLPVHEIKPDVLETEEAVGQAMLEEIVGAARHKEGDLVIILLGGRGAQALHRRLSELARTGEADELLSRLRVFTQDALAPMRMESG